MTNPGRVFLSLILLFCCACKTSPLGSRWMVYYGRDLESKILKKIDLVVLDPDQVPSPPPGRTKKIGYLSLGEAEDYRSYWTHIPSQVLVESNPQWPGAHRIDMRQSAWQDLVLNELIPQILAKGFEGVFLDTVDTAAYLEETRPQEFQGSVDAAIELIGKMRAKFPQMIILLNNALPLLPRLEGFIDGVTVEDLYTRYDFDTKRVGATPAEDSISKEKLLDAFIARTHKPVLNILYEDPQSSSLSEESIKRSEQKGYLWYLATVDLMSPGRVKSQWW